MWEICACQDADSLFGVFNTAAANRASKGYGASIAAVAFGDFAAALIAYAFAPEQLQVGATASFRETVRLKSYQPCPCSRSKKP
ncbi:hypothetical protein [Burkholderia pseudomallei]|uniref:hypothetical protein n=1 Tax=Burkholderia pseudomallei TaxID=28450 RepID=UPI000A71CEEC|nr:hypothetical protein [Burkholderia pseudomallei]